MCSVLSCPIKASCSGSMPGKIVAQPASHPATPASRSPPGVNSLQRPAWQAHCWVIDDVAVFNYFYLCFWHRDVFELFFPLNLSKKTNHSDKDLQTQVSSCLPLLTTYHLCIKKHYTEQKRPPENTVGPDSQLE